MDRKHPLDRQTRLHLVDDVLDLPSQCPFSFESGKHQFVSARLQLLDCSLLLDPGGEHQPPAARSADVPEPTTPARTG